MSTASPQWLARLQHGKRPARKSRLRRQPDASLKRLLVDMRTARIRAGITQEQLAYRMRTTKSAISRLERGLHSRPRLTTIENYALVIGCRVEIRLRRGMQRRLSRTGRRSDRGILRSGSKLVPR